ncbi:MAG TPA: hypothetical protein VFQ53_03745 [Kofleriaceae bacterium]|nr:hypothetical protein [Kofleriaceae bacterium]
MRVRSVVLGVALAGCWTAPPPREPTVVPEAEPVPAATSRAFRTATPRPCTVAVDHAVEISREEIERVTTLRERIEAIRDAAIESCETDHWSDAAISCFANAADGTDVNNCEAQMTSDQRADLDRRMIEALSVSP